MQDYAFTVKYNKPTDEYKTVYDDLFGKWQKRGVTLKYKEMHTDAKIWHYHGLITLPRDFYLKRLMKDGFHLKLNLVYDVTGWIDYCRKNHVNILPNLFKTSSQTLPGEVSTMQATEQDLTKIDETPILTRSLFKR